MPVGTGDSEDWRKLPTDRRTSRAHWPRFILAVTTMIAANTTEESRGGQIRLTADWNRVRRRKPYPVTTGIPFARGVLRDAERVRLTAAGKKFPLQTKVLAWWPDKSIKWLLLDFQAPPGVKSFVLSYGAGVKRAPRVKGIAAKTTATAVNIDTGPLKFTVKAGGSGFLDSVSYMGRRLFGSAGKRLNFMDMIHTDSPADYRPMDRYITGGKADPSRLTVDSVSLEDPGPLRATVVINGRYRYKLVGSTIKGTDIKGDCPFRIRITAYAGQSYLKIEHFYYYEGDGDHDFTKSLGLKLPLPSGAGEARFIDTNAKVTNVAGPLAGLYQQSADDYQIWRSDGKSVQVVGNGDRFDGVLDVSTNVVGITVGVKDFWQNHAKSLHADLTDKELAVYLWPPEAPPLDYRRHAREWSVGESYSPKDPDGTDAAAFDRRKFPNYHLASKGVGKTHYALVYFHKPSETPREISQIYKLFNRRPLLWAPARHYASTLALGRYRQRVPGQHTDIERALDMPAKFWQFSQEHFRWYGFWLYGQVCQDINHYQQNGRWVRDFGRWGWACGDSVGRLAYALMLQAVRKCTRKDIEFAEKYLYSVHDVCSTHSEAYPHHFRKRFIYIKGASHRHGAWPWAGPYCGARGSHPVGAKIYYFLTGEGHAKDILEEMTQLAITNPHGGEGDGPLGINAQCFLYQWEATGDDKWRQMLKAELDNSRGLRTATSGWLVMMNAAFGIYNALEEYMDLTGDYSYAQLAADYADRAMPKVMRDSWTWPDGYFRVYACGYNYSGNKKYIKALQQSLPIFVNKTMASIAGRTPEKDWPGVTGGPRDYVDGNVIRDIPFALYSLHGAPIIRKGAPRRSRRPEGRQTARK